MRRGRSTAPQESGGSTANCLGVVGYVRSSIVERAVLSLAPLLLVAGLAPPPVASGPASTGRCGDPAERPWCDARLTPDERTELLLAEMTLEERFSLMGGDDPIGVFTGEPANGTSEGIERLGIPTLFFNDGPAGLRKGRATALPAPVSLAAAFDPTGARRAGGVVGDEARKRGIDVVHAPAVNIVRTPLGGRSFEYYGEDPLLAARTGVGFIRGLQGEGAIANVKHYVANNQETDRFVTNAIVDERTLREIYLPAFEAAVVDAGVGTVMLAYNRVNGRKVTENAELVNGVLKRDLGFTGFALTDYGMAQVSTADAANAGTDLEMPRAFWFSPEALRVAVASGQVSPSVVDEAVRRILRTMFRFGVFDRARDDPGEIDVEGHSRAARRLAEQGMVLLKNDRGVLPLDASRLRSVAVIGPESDEYRSGGGSSRVEPSSTVTPLEGIRRRAGDDVEVVHDTGYVPQRAAQVAAAADVAIVVVNDDQTEFVDEACLSLQCGDPTNGDQDGLVRAVAAANPRTVVVLETGSPVLMPWEAEVPAIVEAWYPGQEGGNAIARMLFGDVDPGGRLPVTFPREEGDTPTSGHPERYPGIAANASYSEGVFVGYRHYDEHGIEPLFPFGHGLSYTTFAYHDLRVRHAPRGDGLVATVQVENTGDRTGTEVVQAYVGKPEAEVAQPPTSLAAFRKVTLDPGERRRVTLHLTRRSLSYWDVARDRWSVADGCYDVLVGSSSRDVRARDRLPLGAAAC